MGPDCDGLYMRKLPMSTRMSAAQQLLKAVESLHKGGIVHRGKLPFSVIPLSSACADLFLQT